MNQTVGTCSICGGRVSVPSPWYGVQEPIPTCEKCGATSSMFGPVIPMQPNPYKIKYTTYTTNTAENSSDIPKGKTLLVD